MINRALGFVLALVIAIGGAASPPSALARDLFESDDGEYRLTLRSALKGSWILSVPYLDDPLRDEAAGGAGLFRLRFEIGAQLTEALTIQVAYEHRSLASSAAGLGAAVLPPGQSPPFRLTPLDWVIVDGAPGYQHRHELDRAFVSLHLPFGELTVGRQAIGLGRGVLFSAIDVFSAFGPNEVDREWRRGVDAVHLELRIPDLDALSGDVIAVFGDVEAGVLASYSVLGRLRAVVGDLDGELVVGRRGEDTMAGGAVSARVGDAELHGELALFGTDGAGVDGGFLGTRGVVAKGLVGGSYMIDVLRGVRVLFEYHYSGFGVENVSRDSHILLDPAYVSRVLRGHSQTLGRHTLALSLSTELSDDLSLSLAYFQSPTDGSGLVAPALSWVPSDILSIAFSVLVPWGTAPSGGIPTSEWGSAPLTVFLQARVYD